MQVMIGVTCPSCPNQLRDDAPKKRRHSAHRFHQETRPVSQPINSFVVALQSDIQFELAVVNQRTALTLARSLMACMNYRDGGARITGSEEMVRDISNAGDTIEEYSNSSWTRTAWLSSLSAIR